MAVRHIAIYSDPIPGEQLDLERGLEAEKKFLRYQQAWLPRNHPGLEQKKKAKYGGQYGGRSSPQTPLFILRGAV